MRSKEMLRDIKNVAKLQAWMYASEENKITVRNACDVELELGMSEDGEVNAKFSNSALARPIPYDEYLSLPVWLGVVEQLQEQPARHPEYFQSRWDEIVHEHAAIAALN